MDLENLLLEQLTHKTKEYQRAFHGRGGCYEGFEFLTIDFIDNVLFTVFFSEVEPALEASILNLLKKLYNEGHFECVVLQRRYLKKAPSEIIEGTLPQRVYAYENGLKFELNFLNNQNIGFFPDMRVGHGYIAEQCNGKNVLNLFSYTCSFSVCAINANAKKVVNVDMSKPALTTGRENHRINDLDTKNVEFMPYNILKSWNRIKKAGPYDLIIIDPPSFQKGSFAATKDYEKIIKRLNELGNKECTVLACLNAPELDTYFIKNLFEENAPEFQFEKRLKNLDTFPCNNEEKTLKNLIFKRVNHD